MDKEKTNPDDSKPYEKSTDEPSDGVESLSEAPVPLTTSSQNSLNARPVRRQTSYFSASNGGVASDEFHDDDNPLNVSNTHFDMQATEASMEDDRKSQGALLQPEFWETLPQMLWEQFRPGFILDHLTWDSAIVVSRTWIPIFVGSILMVIDKTGAWLGAASYVSIICSVIQVSGDVTVSQAFYTGLLDMSFVLYGFLHSVIANAITWRMRGYPTSEQLIAELVQQGICKEPSSNCFLHEIHQGRYLTTKTTVISMIAMVFALTGIGYGQMKFPPAIPSWIWANIIIFISGAYLNMTPVFMPWTYGAVIVKPVAIALSLRFVTALLWFPMSSNYKFLRGLTGIMKSTGDSLSAAFNELRNAEITDPNLPKIVEGFEQRISKSLSSFVVLKFDGMLSRAELTYSRFDPGNLGELRALTRDLVAALAGPRFFYIFLLEKKAMIQDRMARTRVPKEPQSEKVDSLQPHGNNPKPKEDTLSSEDGSTKTDSSNQSDAVVEALVGQPHSPNQEESSGAINSTGRYNGDPFKLRNRTETFSESQAPDWVKKNSWLDKKLGKHYAQVARFEEARLAHADELVEHGIDVESLEALRKKVVAHYDDFIAPATELSKVLVEWIEEANRYRAWTLLLPGYRKKRQLNQAMQREKLENAIAAVKTVLANRGNQFLENWVHSLCVPGAVKSRQHYVYSLTLDAHYGNTQQRIAESLLQLASYCLRLDEYRPRACLIFPFMKSLSRSPRFENEYHSSDDMGTEGAGVHDSPFDSVSQVQVRSPDSSPPRTLMHLIGRYVQKIYNICTDPTLVFCIKRALVGTFSCMLLFTRTTIYFAYSERIIWAPIMVGLSVTQRAVDGIYGLLVRSWYTFLGSVFGMVIWYTGSGHGEGNPYGMAASISCYMLLLVFYRHYHNVAVPMGAIVLCVTTVLVPGTGWTTTHGFSLDNEVGYGFSVAWRRFVLVVCGVIFAFLGSILPRSTTAKKRLRVILGKCFEELGDIQAGIAGYAGRRLENPDFVYSLREDPILRKIRSVKESVLSANRLVALINFEPALGGSWPKSRYLMLMKLLGDVAFLLEDLHFIAGRVDDPVDLEVLLQRSGWTSIELTSSLYSVLMLCSRALSSGQPLPSVTPGYLTELYNRQLKSFLAIDVADGENGLEGFMEERYLSHNGRYALSFVSAASGVYRRLDTSMRIIKGLVGEIYAVNQSLLESDQEQTPLMWGRKEA